MASACSIIILPVLPFLTLLASSYVTPIVSNRTIESTLSHLIPCANSTRDVERIEKWIASVQRTIHGTPTDPSYMCEEEWLSCLLAPSDTLPEDTFPIRLLIKSLNLCSETSVTDLSSTSDVSFHSIILIAFALLNLTAISSGLWIYAYRSECKVGLRNNAEQ